MTVIDVTNVERHPDGKLVYVVRVQAVQGRMEFPIAVKDEGSAARNEEAVLRSALRLAEELSLSLRSRLGT